MKHKLLLLQILIFGIAQGLKAQEGIPIDGFYYALNDETHEAMLNYGRNWSERELVLPSEVTYNGQVYTVTTMSCLACRSVEAIVRVVIPKSIREIVNWYYIPDYDYYFLESNKNPFFGCPNLRSIEVEEGHPTMSSVDGVLYNKEGTYLYAYPSASDRTYYQIPKGVKDIGSSSFAYCPFLKVVDIPETVNYIEGQSLFYGCPLEALIIRGTPWYNNEFPSGLTSSATIYVQPSEIEKVTRIFGGNVLPLDSYTAIHDLAAPEMVNGTSSNSPWYDLSGRRVSVSSASSVPSVLPKGVYIKDGKKVMVK